MIVKVCEAIFHASVEARVITDGDFNATDKHLKQRVLVYPPLHTHPEIFKRICYSNTKDARAKLNKNRICYITSMECYKYFVSETASILHAMLMHWEQPKLTY
jgi:hypothetical protein